MTRTQSSVIHRATFYAPSSLGVRVLVVWWELCGRLCSGESCQEPRHGSISGAIENSRAKVRLIHRVRVRRSEEKVLGPLFFAPNNKKKQDRFFSES